MDESARVELDLEVDRADVDVRPDDAATLLVLGVALDVHDAVEARVAHVDVHLHAVGQAVDQHVGAREVRAGEGRLCAGSGRV